MEHKGVEYTVVQLAGGAGWKWEVRFGDGKNKSGVTPESRALAIKLAEYEIDRVLKDRTHCHSEAVAQGTARAAA
jgi:hypothetical protein